MDITNKRTRLENRWLNLSPFMYEEAKNITLAEINKTTLENRQPQGSKIKGRVILVEFNLKRVQLIKIIELDENKYRDKKNGKGRTLHRSLLALIEKEGMVESI